LLVPAFGLGTIVALSTTALAGVDTTTQPTTTNKTVAIVSNDLRTIKRPEIKSKGLMPFLATL
jgi:hypothetical protein